MNNEDIRIESRRNPVNQDVEISAIFREATSFTSFERDLYHEVIKLIAHKYLEENYIEIAERLSPEAIANLAVARASEHIATSNMAIAQKPSIQQDYRKYSLF